MEHDQFPDEYEDGVHEDLVDVGDEDPEEADSGDEEVDLEPSVVPLNDELLRRITPDAFDQLCAYVEGACGLNLVYGDEGCLGFSEVPAVDVLHDMVGQFYAKDAKYLVRDGRVVRPVPVEVNRQFEWSHVLWPGNITAVASPAPPFNPMDVNTSESCMIPIELKLSEEQKTTTFALRGFEDLPSRFLVETIELDLSVNGLFANLLVRVQLQTQEEGPSVSAFRQMIGRRRCVGSGDFNAVVPAMTDDSHATTTVLFGPYHHTPTKEEHMYGNLSLAKMHQELNPDNMHKSNGIQCIQLDQDSATVRFLTMNRHLLPVTTHPLSSAAGLLEFLDDKKNLTASAVNVPASARVGILAAFEEIVRRRSGIDPRELVLTFERRPVSWTREYMTHNHIGANASVMCNGVLRIVGRTMD